ncbi:Smr/MutS family protein [bacterium]|nr:Smr/MutS family protein [FCB group bacterium]MBL7190214.1 Smr/MutS family protein [bacterium]
MAKYSGEHWEMVKWLEQNSFSLEDKYDLQNAPRRRRKKQVKRKDNREPEAALDLHGLTQEEAFKEIRNFILGSKLKGYYLIKIIHGKGLHSPGEAKLKALVIHYLNNEGRNLYSSWQYAPDNQGGEGAVLVFL